MAHKIERRTARGYEEGGRQTTKALGQPGRERETKIKKLSLLKKRLFSAIRSVWLEFLIPLKINSFPFRFISLNFAAIAKCFPQALCYIINTLVLILQVLTCTSWYYTKVYCTKMQYFIKKYTFFETQRALLSIDTSVEKILGDRCIRHICIYTMVARPNRSMRNILIL
jgi:hypothetical protein